ncbi:protein-lysine N-methyltransferase SMYD4-like [Lycorma delicatula]|uniref:protein-lysine N-methyltransferase SMYD4-like n=1 Tax=Lycorma delicatula TaxID=130591 RepID=UPI003F518286
MLNTLENNIGGFFKKQHLQLCSSLEENDLNNFSLLNNNEDKFKFVCINPFVRSNQISKLTNDKNLNVAKQLKTDGNKAFQANDYSNALFKYSKSVLKCPQDNGESLQELAIVLANRFAVFYHIGEHQKALDNINAAFESGYPSSLYYKVYDRKARCLLALKQHKSAIEAFRCTLTTLDDAKLPLERRQKWQKDVQIMLAMLSKNPVKDVFFTLLNTTITCMNFTKAIHLNKNYTDCHLEILISPYPCPKCSNVAFCSKMCQNVAMTSHHVFECSILPTLWASGASITCHMALRMFTQKNLEYFKEIKSSLKQENVHLEKNNFDDNDYRSVYYLERNESQRSVEDFLQRTHMAVFLFKCLKTAGFFINSDSNEEKDSQLSDDELYIGGLMLHNLQFLQFNAHEVSELDIKDDGIDKATSLFLGGAIYPTLSLFNHSCNPAIVRYFQGTTVICRAIRTTFEGEMVAENYGPNFTQTPKNERQDILKRQYWFNCNCVACKEDWPLFSEMDESIMRFRCETKGCKNIIKVPTDTLKFMALCPVCNQHMNLLKGLKALQDTDSMFRVAHSFMIEGDINKALIKFIELLQMLDETLAPPFKDFHLCQQAARICMLTFGNKSMGRKI